MSANAGFFDQLIPERQLSVINSITLFSRNWYDQGPDPYTAFVYDNGGPDAGGLLSQIPFPFSAGPNSRVTAVGGGGQIQSRIYMRVNYDGAVAPATYVGDSLDVPGLGTLTRVNKAGDLSVGVLGALGRVGHYTVSDMYPFGTGPHIPYGIYTDTGAAGSSVVDIAVQRADGIDGSTSAAGDLGAIVLSLDNFATYIFVNLASSDFAFTADTNPGLQSAATPVPTIAISSISPSGPDYVVSGTVGGDAQPNDVVSVVASGFASTGGVAPDRSWSITVPGSRIHDGSQVTATVSSTNAGGTGTATANRTYTAPAAPAGPAHIVSFKATSVSNGGNVIKTESNPLVTYPLPYDLTSLGGGVYLDVEPPGNDQTFIVFTVTLDNPGKVYPLIYAPDHNTTFAVAEVNGQPFVASDASSLLSQLTHTIKVINQGPNPATNGDQAGLTFYSDPVFANGAQYPTGQTSVFAACQLYDGAGVPNLQ